MRHLNRATVTESMISVVLIVAISTLAMIALDLEPIYAAGVALVVLTIGNAAYWKLRGESALYSFKRRTEYEWETEDSDT